MFSIFIFTSQADKHQPALINLICEQLNTQPEQIMDFELCLADTQPAVSEAIFIHTSAL